MMPRLGVLERRAAEKIPVNDADGKVNNCFNNNF